MSKALVLAALLTFGVVNTVGIMQPQQSIAQQVAPAFTTLAQLEAKYRRLQLGMTKAQVKQILGIPQWSTADNWNYFIQQKGSQDKDTRNVRFDKNGRVKQLGGMAG